MQPDITKLQKQEQEGNIVFNAHPTLHGYPWSVPDTISNKHVFLAIKKQVFQEYRGTRGSITNIVAGLQQTAHDSTWHAAALQTTPNRLWAHENELRPYQVWVCYRAALRQLNLNFEGREQDNSCKKLKSCTCKKVTLEHILWSCPCAMACWYRLICHWTGQQWGKYSLAQFHGACASRGASTTRQKWLQLEHPDEVKEYATTWKRLRRILCSVCITSLWIQRKRKVF
jgi:hypothetical protein